MEYVVCNLCGAPDAPPYCKVGEFQIVRCSACGLFYTNPRRPASEMAEFYSENYFSSENPSRMGYDNYAVHEKGLKQVFAEHLSVIEKYVYPPASMLDIGCAFGYFIQVAASRKWATEGIEISRYASRVARENTGAHVHTGTLLETNLKEASYDAVTMWDVLEHSHDPSRELAEANRIMKPNAYLFMTVPDAGSLPARLMARRWYGFKSAAEHNYFFTRDTIERLLAKTGFALVESRRGTWPCSLRFLVSKLAPYSPAASRLAARAVGWFKAERVIIKFKFIDMFVVVQKRGDISRVSSDSERGNAESGIR